MLLPLPTLQGERVIVRGRRDSDIDDRLRYPIDPEASALAAPGCASTLISTARPTRWACSWPACAARDSVRR